MEVFPTRLKYYFSLSLLICFAYLSSFAQDYNFQSLSIADGLPQSQVWAAINDSRGYLWFGTQGGGLSRYDGQDFEVFTTANGLPSNFIHAIYQEKDYSIWIGTNRGLSHFNGRSFQAIPNFQEQVNTIILQPDSSLMIGTESGLYRLSLMDTVVTKINLGIELDELSILSFCHYKGSLFVGTSNGLWEISDMVQQRYIGKQIFAIAPDNREQLWLADFGNGLLVYDTKTHEINEKIRTSSIYLTTALYHVNAIDLLIGTQNKGLIQFNKVTGETSIISEKDGLPHSHVRCLTEDINGRIWISTSGGGIACRLQQNFQHFTRKNGLIGSRIYAIHKDTAGNIWNAVSRNGIQILDSTGFQSILNEPQLQGIKCKSICSDGSGSVWIGTEGRGLFKQDTIGWIPINARDGLPSNWILKLLKDQQNGIWGATYGSGIFQTSYEDSLIIKTYANELPSKKMGTIQLDRLSRLWFATQNGILGFIDDQGNVQIPAQEGIAGIPIRSIAFDQYHQIWIGTKGEGIYFSQLDTLLAFTKLADIKPNYTQNVYQLFADSSSNIWAGSENGVERIELDSLGQIKNIFHFGKDDGFSGIETCHESYLLEEDGSIWFGTMNGLTHYKAGDITSQCHTPLLHFTSTELFYKSLDQTAWKDFYLPKGGIKSGLILPHKQNHLSFGFKAISQLQATDIEYRWKLNGTENDWSPPSKTTTVNYANLAPGDYSFEVQSALKNCNWSKSLRAAFTIKAPYWQEKWFIWSVASAALILLALSILAYVHRIKKQARLAQQKLEIENKVLQLEQKALQLQMNPHFIFNALTSINALLVEENYQNARNQINAFAKLMRSILYNSRKPHISLEDEIKTLETYLKMEQFCQRQAFDYKIELSEGINKEELELPSMLLQPFVENAVVHGIAHLNKKGNISIHFSLEQDLLKCTIKDNGIGRKKAAQLQVKRSPNHKSVALKVIKERLESFQIAQKEPLKISDILSPLGKIIGTKVEVWMPVQFAY